MKLPWISVEDRLPSDPRAYVAVWYVGRKTADWAEASCLDRQWFTYNGDELENVTHWLEVVPPEEIPE